MSRTEYIEREAAIKELINDAPEQVGYSREDAADCIRYMDAVDVAPGAAWAVGVRRSERKVGIPVCL